MKIHLRHTLRLLVRVGLVISLTGTTSLGGAIGPAEAATLPRAMWVWSFTNASATVKLAKAHGVTQLFLSVPPNVTTSPLLPGLRALSSRARAAGLRVDALGGDPAWVDDPQAVINSWLRPVLASGLFTGVHVDIEPYSADPAARWNTDRAGVVEGYLATLDALVSAAGPGTPVEADIPFWFHQIPANSSTLDRQIIQRTAGVTIMAYRNNAQGGDGTIALAAPEMAAALSLGKPARIGQETNYLGPDPASVKQTFHGKTRAEMETQLALIQSTYSGDSSYAGLAIHDYTGYAAMRR